MSEVKTLSAISGISDPEKIRVVLYANGNLIQAPLTALLKPLTEKIDALEKKMEGK